MNPGPTGSPGSGLPDPFEKLDALARRFASKAKQDPRLEEAAHKEQHQFETQKKRDEAELQNTENLNSLRMFYGKSIPWIVAVWLAIVALIVVAVGLECVCFTLSDTVLVTLLTTTTVEVIGLTVIVTRSLFPAVKEDKPKK